MIKIKVSDICLYIFTEKIKKGDHYGEQERS